MPLLLVCLLALQKLDVEIAEGVKMEFVKIRAGEFTMSEGASAWRVTLTKDYWMQTTEVTQAQWKALMEKNPSYFGGIENAAQCPVEQVSWDDAQKFIEKLNGKLKEKKASLPTEAEWEHAARAGTLTKWSFGDEKAKLEHHAWFDNNSALDTHPVAKKKPNAWGLYDMHGGVWEWCADWLGELPGKNAADPTGPGSGTERVVRGGGFDDKADDTRSAARKGADPSKISGEGKNKEIGFRIVLR